MSFSARSRSARFRHRTFAGLGGAALLALLAGCAPTAGTPDSSSRVLQSVHVALTSDGSVRAIDGKAVYLDAESKETTSTETSYRAEEVVDDLPVRVITQYRTDKRSGSDLSDLKGYTGRLELSVAVENLTVAPRTVFYDVAGSKRTAPALVGAPLSIVASTTLGTTGPSVVIVGGDDNGTTNGVVSSSPVGDAVGQWASILAPPQTGATARFSLAADVKDFAVPRIDLALQPGIHTDLSFEGVLGSAFDTSPTSALGLQQRTITVIADVNAILSRAGVTITEVRDNLDDTAKTLGVRTAQDLRGSSESLTASMRSLGEQLTGLQRDLHSSVSSTESAMSAQLRSTVDSMVAMLGDTWGTPPSLLEGDGCAATVSTPEAGSTMYSSLLQPAGQLDAYAQANEGCRDRIVADLQRTVGPEEPADAACAEPSATCALYDAGVTATQTMIQLVARGQELIGSLDSKFVHDAVSHYGTVSDDIDTVIARLGTLRETIPTPAVLAAVSDRLDDAIVGLEAFDTLHAVAGAQLAELGGAGEPGSILAQNAALAAALCQIPEADGVLDAAQRDELRSYLTGTACDGVTSLTAPAGYSAALDARLDAQATAWTTVHKATDPDDANSALGRVRAALKAAQKALTAAQSTDADQRGKLLAALDLADAQASAVRTDADTLRGDLLAVSQQQDTLAAAIAEAFQDAADDTNSRVAETVSDQIRVVSEQGRLSREALTDSYDRTIAGLTSTSDRVLDESGRMIDQQKRKLAETDAKATAALSERTAEALDGIARSTTASALDVVSATALLQGVLLDLGDRSSGGAGLLGAMSASAAKSDTADFQLALASQNAAGYANIRAEDIAGILLGQAQFSAALDEAAAYPPFHLTVPSGASWQTIYSFQIGGGQ